jgi:hypothetical protein
VQRFREEVGSTPFEVRLATGLTQKASTLKQLQRKHDTARPDGKQLAAQRAAERATLQELRAEHLGDDAPLPEGDAECDAALEQMLEDDAVRAAVDAVLSHSLQGAA